MARHVRRAGRSEAIREPLLIPDLERLGRKLANPPPLLAGLYRRFLERLAADAEFRRYHVFLPAVLGDPGAIAEAKAIILKLAAQPLLLVGEQLPAGTAQDRLDRDIWCVAPRAMRLAVYFTWLDAREAWTPDERRAVAAGVLEFFYHYVIPVLRARTPAGQNQQLSMTLCGAVAGHAFAGVPAVAARARALEAYALPKLRQTLGLMPGSGYSGEGSTYQSDVVSPLVTWAGIFLEQLGEPEVWTRQWAPRAASLADTLRMETLSAGCGGLLPPWDHYGWARLHNLAARTVWAGLTGAHHLLAAAATAWDVVGLSTWQPDDRLWTVIYWPEEEQESGIRGQGARGVECLAGWSLPAAGAAIEHLPTRLRVMAVWDRCSGGLQGIGRGQANPNHLMIDLAGEPITADGKDDGSRLLFSEASTNRTLDGLSDIERELVVQQYGSLDRWVRCSQEGFLGASCAIVVDDWDSYFPREGWEGGLSFEARTPDRHTFAADAAAFYRPAFDVTRMRRTVSVGASGVAWVVDDIRAQSPHRFTWRAWFRTAMVQEAPLRVRLGLPSGVAMTLAWLAEGDAAGPPAAITLGDAPTFPWGRKRLAWPDRGSTRCDLAATGRRVRFVACMVPRTAAGLGVRRTGPGAWEALWEGGGETFEMPPLREGAPDAPPQPLAPEALCDLDEAPFALSDEPDAVLRAALAGAPVAEWRRTGAAMQTLTVRGCSAAMPEIAALLQDARQNYTVHSVAAWCLGHARYRPAREALRRMSHIPEVNTALRAGWALERMAADEP